MRDFDISIPGLLLAQNDFEGFPPGAAPESAVTTSEGSQPLGDGTGNTAAAARPTGLDAMILPMIIVLFAVMLIVSMLGSRREKKRRETMMSSIQKHDTVQTAGGVIGSVVEVKPDTVILKVDESSNTRITFSKTAVQQIIASRSSRNDKGAPAEATA